jgi:hypothetical protein
MEVHRKLKPKTFDRVKRYVRRHEHYHLCISSSEPVRLTGFDRPASVVERRAMASMFDRARAQGKNLGDRTRAARTFVDLKKERAQA